MTKLLFANTAILIIVLFTSKLMADETIDSSRYYIQVCDSFSKKYQEFHAEPKKFYDAIRWFDSVGDKYQSAKSHVLLANYYYENMESDSACNHYLNAINGFLEIGETDSISLICSSLASCEYYSGNYNESKYYYQLGLKYPASQKVKGLLYTGLALCYDNMDLLDSAIATYGKALSIYRNINDSLGIAYLNSNIGSFYLKIDDYQDAKKYLLRAYDYLKIKNDRHGLAAVINNLAVLYSKSNDYQAELLSYKEVYSIDSTLNDQAGMSADLNNIGLTYAELKDTSNAIRSLTRALIIADSVHAKSMVLLSAYNLGDLLYDIDSMSKAKVLVEKCYDLAVSTNNLSMQISALKLLSEIYSKTGQYNKAYNLLLDYSTLYDSLFSREKFQLLANAKEKYEAVQKQNKILALEKKNLQETSAKKRMFTYALLISAFLIIIIVVFFIVNKNRRQAEFQKQYFSKLLSNSIEYKFVLGKDGTLKYVSPSYVTMFFGNKGDAMKDSFLRSLSEKDIEDCKSKFQLMIDGKKMVPFNYRIKDIHGRERYVTGKAQNFLDDELIKGIIVNLWDITDLKNTDQSLKKREKELEEANRTKEKLFSIISHDLLGHIGTSSELMKLLDKQYQDFDEAMIQKIISSVSKSLEATNTLVVNLLSWARIQMKKISTTRETTLLYPILENVIKLYESQLAEKSITMNLECDRTITVLIDINQIEIVFRNLLRNAIKFTQNGGNIKLYCQVKKPLVNVCIEDDGVGMTENQVRHMMAGSRTLKSTIGTNNEKGTGLGVVVVKEFVHLNKGKLRIKSTPGEGTKVCITLLS